MTPRRRILPVLLLAASAWLAAGPGGVTLLAAAACRHHPVSHAMHGDGSGNQPCYCDHMTGGSDVVAAPALAAAPVVEVLFTGPVRSLPLPVPPSLRPGTVRAPTPPPPNPLA